MFAEIAKKSENFTFSEKLRFCCVRIAPSDLTMMERMRKGWYVVAPLTAGSAIRKNLLNPR